MLPSRIFFDSLLDDYEDSRFKKSMKSDIFEKDGNYNVVMDIPGFKKEDINIECDNGVIKISCEKKLIGSSLLIFTCNFHVTQLFYKCL